MSWLSKSIKRAFDTSQLKKSKLGRAFMQYGPGSEIRAITGLGRTLAKGTAGKDKPTLLQPFRGNLKSTLALTREAHRIQEDPSGRAATQYKLARNKMESADPTVQAEGRAEMKEIDKKSHRLGITHGTTAIALGALAYGGAAALAGEGTGGAGAGAAGAGAGTGEAAAVGGMEAWTGGTAATAEGASIAELAAGGAGVGGAEAGALAGGTAGGAGATGAAGGLFGTGVTAGQALEGLSAASSIYSGIAGAQQAAAAERAAAADDPMAASRAGYAQQLAGLAADPSSIIGTPGYEEGLEYGEQALQRQLAASGRLGSGAEKIASQQLGQTYSANVLGAERTRLSMLAGGGTAPTAFAGQSAYTNAISQALASLGYGVTNLYQGAVA